jgi:hypothetical protein
MGYASQNVGDSSQKMGERFFKVLASAIPGLRFVFVDWEMFLWFWNLKIDYHPKVVFGISTNLIGKCS